MRTASSSNAVVTMISNKTLSDPRSVWLCNLPLSNMLYNISVFDVESNGGVSAMPALLLPSFNPADAILQNVDVAGTRPTSGRPHNK